MVRRLDGTAQAEEERRIRDRRGIHPQVAALRSGGVSAEQRDAGPMPRRSADWCASGNIARPDARLLAAAGGSYDPRRHRPVVRIAAHRLSGRIVEDLE
jgi:hypothetical protein